MNLRQCARDLGLGVRFAFAGGREGWIRAVLTALGVGLGVAVLLLTTAVPNALAVRHDREEARMDYSFSSTVPPTCTLPGTSLKRFPIPRAFACLRSPRAKSFR